MEKDEFFVRRIRELAHVSYQREIVTFSDFLNLNEQNMVNSRMSREPGVTMEAFGGYEHAERQMVAFHPDALPFPWEFPIDCLRMEPKALKFSEPLSHRDFLGAILNLGVDRGMVGDILVQDKSAWMFCHSRMSDFFAENLTRVRHTEILVSKVNDFGELPSPKLAPVSGTCSSVRLDALIALAFQASRSSMVSCIEKGLVFVNGRLVTSNGYEPHEGDVISVRGKGRFIFEGVSRKTKKGRYSVQIQRYV